MSLNQESIISTLQKTIDNNEKLKKEQEYKIEELEEIITELEGKLSYLDNIITENNNLKFEINKLYDIIKTKNQLISEFEKLAEISTQKFETYINNDIKNKTELEKKNKKYSELKSKHIPLIQQFSELQNQYNKLIEDSKKEKIMSENEILSLNEKNK